MIAAANSIPAAVVEAATQAQPIVIQAGTEILDHVGTVVVKVAKAVTVDLLYSAGAWTLKALAPADGANVIVPV